MNLDSNTFADSICYQTNNRYHLASIQNRRILLGDLLIFWVSLSTIRLWYLNGRKLSIHQEIRLAFLPQALWEMAFHSFCCPYWLYDQVTKVEGSHNVTQNGYHTTTADYRDGHFITMCMPPDYCYSKVEMGVFSHFQEVAAYLYSIVVSIRNRHGTSVYSVLEHFSWW